MTCMVSRITPTRRTALGAVGVKWYTYENLEAAALQTHGEAGHARKHCVRTKRVENKRMKEEAAAEAELNKRQNTSNAEVNDENAAPQPSGTSTCGIS
jgi:hypothetical protein